jgi:diadenosine tetraphosphate (Ap4A) HIT family hydrolase
LSDCPFCSPAPATSWIDNEDAIALRDIYPVSPGHSLVIPRRHVPSLFALSPEELAGVARLVLEVRNRLQEERRPDGFNIGVNDGAAAGQTVMHAHVHVIPRFAGDVPDPRGGIRWVVPDLAPYWDGP